MSASPVLTRDDWHLLTKGHGGSWWLLWLLTDYETARSHAVSGQGGGTYYFRDGERRGWYAMTKDGLLATDSRDAILGGFSKPAEATEFLPWKKLKAWSAVQTAETKAEARALRARSQELQRTFPNIYPGIGRPYGWDMKPRASDEQIAKDRADLAAAQEVRAAERDAHRVLMREHEEKIHAFFEPMAPTMLDDIILAQRAAA